jgi:3-deoxy-D-manno-octulosonic-acid transferase
MILLRLYRLLTDSLAVPFVKYHLYHRLRKGKEIAERMLERQGKTCLDVQHLSKRGPLVWVHAASVGESLSVLTLIRNILERYPSCFILFTTGTITSASLLEKKLPPRVFHQFVPLDIQPWVVQFLENWRPCLALWVESEIWPNLIWEASQRKIPLIMINGRMSEKSFRKWQWARSLISPLLNHFEVCFAQSSNDAQRLRFLGAKQVIEAGNLKFAADPLEYNKEELENFNRAIHARPIWVAASTHDPEEEIIIKTHHLLRKKFPTLLTVIVPRHPERGAFLRKKYGHELCLSQRSFSEPISDKTEVYLADTLGELGIFYRLSSIIFVGGSLVPIGGHNLIEPALLKTAIIHGPHMDNFKEVKEAFHHLEAAIQIATAEELASCIERLLISPEERERLGQAAYKAARAQNGVIERIMQELKLFINPYLCLN